MGQLGCITGDCLMALPYLWGKCADNIVALGQLLDAMKREFEKFPTLLSAAKLNFSGIINIGNGTWNN